MNQKTKTIIHFLNSNGKSPFVDWIRKLRDARAKQIVEARIDRLSFGYYGDCKSVGNGVVESRIFFGPGYRIYFAEINENILILLIAGDKGTQNDDIKKAKKYWKSYQKDQKGFFGQLR